MLQRVRKGKNVLARVVNKSVKATQTHLSAGVAVGVPGS